MRIFRNQVDNRTPRQTRAAAGFTLVEMMFSVGILTLVVMAMLASNLLGMREDQLVESKCGASDTSRRTLQQLPTDIRSSKMWNLGSISGTNFTANLDGAPQQGAALQLCLTTNGSQYILYYFDTTYSSNSNGRLFRTSNTNWNPVIMASNLINTLYFTAENYNGVIQNNDVTSKSYKNVVHTILQFCQFQYPLTQVGTNGLYNYYRIDFRATPHLPE